MTEGYCGYCEVLYFDPALTGKHREGCPNAQFGTPDVAADPLACPDCNLDAGLLCHKHNAFDLSQQVHRKNTSAAELSFATCTPESCAPECVNGELPCPFAQGRGRKSEPRFCGHSVCGDRGGPTEACGKELPCSIREHNDLQASDDALAQFPELGHESLGAERITALLHNLPITLRYMNHRSEESERRIIPQCLWFGITKWHPEEGWVLDAIDTEKNQLRSFALKDCRFSR